MFPGFMGGECAPPPLVGGAGGGGMIASGALVSARTGHRNEELVSPFVFLRNGSLWWRPGRGPGSRRHAPEGPGSSQARILMETAPASTRQTARRRAGVIVSFRKITPSSMPKTTEVSRRAATREMGAWVMPQRERP